MKTPHILRSLRLATVIGLCLGAGLGQVSADDTEVFFPVTVDNTTQFPNLLFMLDTSGSMACAKGLNIDAGNGNICAADTDPITRIERLKSAMIQVLDDLPTTINVGLGRFSGGQGAAILFPVKSIDAKLSTVTGNKVMVDAYTSGLAGSEAEEDLTGGNITFASAVSPDSSVRVGTYDPAIALAGNYVISDNFDTAEEWSDGTIETGNATGLSSRRCFSTDGNTSPSIQGLLELFWNATAYTNAANKGCIAGVATVGTPGKQIIGLRFKPVDIPKDATITSAILRLTTGAASSAGGNPSGNAGDVRGIVVGENVGNSAAFAISNTFSNTLSAIMNNPRTRIDVAGGNIPAVGQVITITSTGENLTRVQNNNETSTRFFVNPASTKYSSGTGFTWSTGRNDLSNRISAAPTASRLVGTIVGQTTSGTVLNLDVGSIIREIHARPDWATTNPMTFLISDDPANPTAANARRFIASSISNAVAADRPTLIVNFTSPSTAAGSVPHKMLTGLRFENVNIPRGATVQRAYLELRARGSQSTNLTPAISLKVTAQAANDSSALQLSASNLSTRSKTTAASAVTWTLPTSVTDEDSVVSPDLKAVIQEVVNRNVSTSDGWCGGNALTIFLDGSANPGTANNKRFLAYSNDEQVVIDSLSEDVVKDGPILHIELSATDAALGGVPPALGGCAARSANSAPAKNDDAEQNVTGGTVNLADSDLELGFDGANRQLIAVRFPSVQVPKDAIIQSATIDFTAVGASTGDAGLKIYAQNIGTAAGLTVTDNSLSALSPQTAKVDWTTADDSLSDWSDQETYTTPNLKTIVKTIVDGSWASGNNMVFLIEANCPGSNVNCSRRAYSRDGKTSAAPRLSIKYQGSALPLTVRDELKRLILDMPASGGTPSVEALYEAARYYRGEDAFYGRTRGSGDSGTSGIARQHRISHVKTFTSGSGQTTPVRPATTPPNTCADFNPGAEDCKTEYWTGTTKYESPITNACSSNNIIFFTDGSPNSNEGEAQVRAMTGNTNCAVRTVESAYPNGGDCAEELTKFLKTNDQSNTGLGNNLAGTQTISTYSVLLGFGSGSSQDTWLDKVAGGGGGTNYLANDSAQLVSAFRTIIGNILDINTTFVAPAVTVNTFNRLINRDELYFALFNPAAQVKWEGNLKKYKLRQFSGVTKVADANNAEAVEVATGFFKTTAQSIWSAAVDGADVQKGGAVSRLTNTRKTYTYTGSNLPPASTPVDLSVSAHGLNSGNTANITNAMVGVPVTGNATTDAAALKDVLDWAQGIDVDDINSNNLRTDARQSIGDPLHSQPLLVSYRGTNDTDTTNDDITLFYGDNEGALHAIDSVTGDEIFSFTPRELLPILNSHRNNLGDYRNRPYGFDGAITRLHRDRNGDLLLLKGTGEAQDNEFLYLYAGMRRGGRNYYSLDVTNRAKPELRWVIYGGSGDYAELGQTWSEAVVRRIKYKNAVKDVIIFSGGYDPDADASIKLKDDADQGRAVYIADALTGERLWWASVSGSNLNLSQMKFSIPASPKVVDLDADGLADRIYVADAGGQVFRFVLNPNHAAADGAAALVTDGSRIAMLSDADTAAGSRTEANARRFFSSPDVAVIDQGSGLRFLSVALGSGFREKPNNNTIQDRFYVLRDPDESKGAVNPLSIFESGTIPSPNLGGVATLYDATANLISEGNTSQRAAAQISLNGSAGFFIKLNEPGGTFIGEKVFTESLTASGNITFASFTPNISSSACQAVAGLSKLYLLSALNGAPAADLSDATDPALCSTTSCNSADRSVNLAQQGLPADPAFIFTKDDTLLCIGSECRKTVTPDPVGKVHWLKRSN